MFLVRNKRRNLKRRKLNKSNNQTQNNLHHETVEIPQDLIFAEILTRLPVNSLTRFKAVSKTWHSIISTTHFIKSHVKRTKSNPFVPSNCIFIKAPYFFYILDYGAYDRCPDDDLSEKGLISVKNLGFSDNGVNTFLIGSCNGLVCYGRGLFSSFIDYRFRVLNPVLGHCYDILDPLGNFGRKLIYGFGFVSSKDDYMLFVGGLQRASLKNFVYVFSLKFKEWKKIGVFDEGQFCVTYGGRGVLVNETLLWDMTQVRVSSVKSCICGFDLVDETFKYVTVPQVDGINVNGLKFRLCEIGGFLCAWVEEINGGLEMWMLMQYGAWNSWKKMCKIDSIPRFDNFYGCNESGKVLVVTSEGSILLGDTDQNPTKYTSVVKDMGDNIEVVSYFRSPVSPFF